MSKYRFKTELEFKRDGLWHIINDVPNYWNSDKEMNHYMGKEIQDRYTDYCDNGTGFSIGQWSFRSTDYVLNFVPISISISNKSESFEIHPITEIKM